MTEMLTAGGAAPGDASTVAAVLLWADERGKFPQGSIWVEVLNERLQSRSLRSPADPVVCSSDGAMALVDAGMGFGQVAATRAADLAVELANDYGVGVVSVKNSNHFGAAGYYVGLIADRGCVGVAMTNAFPKVAAENGTRAALGTNPVAFGAPVRSEPPLIADFSSGSLAGSRVREAVSRGEQLPTGMVVDADGRPTTDPRALDAGGVMLPASGPKGYGLGLMVEVLTACLAGGAIGEDIGSVFDVETEAGLSHLLLAVRPSDPHFDLRVKSLGDFVRQSGEAVRLPGQRGPDLSNSASDAGIELPEQTRLALKRSAERLDLEMPEELQ
ncbi:MAG: ureidoglycolate dehydrogenase (NAD+) [Acidimicrobiales bacterium]|jgi:ureidoglycolate dehydrogenase (NAD+)